MTDDERTKLLERIKAATNDVKKMSRDEARKRLIDDGLYTEDGHLSVQYGGKVAAHG